MNPEKLDIYGEEVSRLYGKLKKDAQAGGYSLNPNEEDTRELVKGLLVNESRYGYWACPCRMADGVREKDLDIICPCDYRDEDLYDYDTCYCSLYVSKNVCHGKKEPEPIPERRSDKMQKKTNNEPEKKHILKEMSYPAWRCKVCGYLCSREHPPELCPVCKADRDRFEIISE